MSFDAEHLVFTVIGSATGAIISSSLTHFYDQLLKKKIII